MNAISRRGFLRQSFAFSALASLGSIPSLAMKSSHKPGAVNWLMIGDWGYERDKGQTAVAAAMHQYAKEHALKTDALIFLGDNWYGPLEGGADSPRWQTHFEDLYPRSSFDCPAYAMLGNHDYQRMPESKVDAELAYAEKPGTRWKMPAKWYTLEFPVVNPLATVIVLDSNVPHPPDPKGVNFTLTPEEHAEQVKWLEDELVKPRRTQYLFVMAHHPIYSNGPHGDHKVLIADWEPLLRKHNVHFYFAGHDHDLQHLEFEGHPTSFVLSGGGGADLYTLKIEEEKRGPYAEKVYGFSHLEMTSEAVTIRHVDANGRLVHGFSKTPAGQIHILGSSEARPM